MKKYFINGFSVKGDAFKFEDITDEKNESINFDFINTEKTDDLNKAIVVVFSGLIFVEPDGRFNGVTRDIFGVADINGHLFRSELIMIKKYRTREEIDNFQFNRSENCCIGYYVSNSFVRREAVCQLSLLDDAILKFLPHAKSEEG